ncbi:hypothetical protein ACSEE7_12455 [Halomonas cupida]|uniref:hypothetical protein n=1 Tax=Halomonas cupida TaxID=44933 RepID=UPI003EF66CF7
MSELKAISIPRAGDITELSEIDAKLAELRETYAVVPDFDTKEGYEEGKKAIGELTSLRTGTDKARLAITKPHRDFVKQVNDFSSSLVKEVETIEQPFRDAKKEVDDRKEREKEARIAKLRDRLNKEITALLDTAVGLDSDGIAGLVEMAEAIDVSNYFDITKEAEDEKARVIHRLREMHSTVLKDEMLAEEREELRREREELERLRAQVAAQAAPAAEPKPVAVPTLSPAPVEQIEATPYDEALEDLAAAGLGYTEAVAILAAIQEGNVRHITYKGE